MGRIFKKNVNSKLPGFQLSLVFILPALLIFPLLFSGVVLAQAFVEADELVVIVPAQYSPYYSTNEKSEPTGFAIDVFEAVAARSGLRYRYEVKKSWSEVTQALQDGVGDIIPNLGISTARSEYLDFTSPVTSFSISIFVRDNDLEIKSAGDLVGKKVAVVSDNIGVTLLKNNEGIQFKKFNEVEIAFYELMTGQIDALIYPEPVMMHIANGFELAHKIRVVTAGLKEVERAIAVRKNNSRLRNDLDVSLQALLQSEQFNQIHQKWFVKKKQQPFWNVAKVFWVMTFLIVLVVIIFLSFRHRELLLLNTSLEQQIEQATLQLSQSNEYLKDLTVTDTLTGISNRRAFEHSLNEFMNRATRYGDSLSMLIFDIDDFKNLNDQYGHDMGDRVLKDLVDRVDEIVRDVDVLSRWGGEEFTILMPRTNQTGAMKMAERCRHVVEKTLFDEVGPVTVSIGVTCFLADDNERKFFKRADDALYQAKSEGKNRVVWKGERCI